MKTKLTLLFTLALGQFAQAQEKTPTVSKVASGSGEYVMLSAYADLHTELSPPMFIASTEATHPSWRSLESVASEQGKALVTKEDIALIRRVANAADQLATAVTFSVYKMPVQKMREEADRIETKEKDIADVRALIGRLEAAVRDK